MEWMFFAGGLLILPTAILPYAPLGFPLAAAALARRLGIREGGEVCLAFTGIGDTLWAIELKTITL